jgi:hypothetical protein
MIIPTPTGRQKSGPSTDPSSLGPRLLARRSESTPRNAFCHPFPRALES